MRGLTLLFCLMFTGCALLGSAGPFFRVQGAAGIGRVSPVRFERTVEKSSFARQRDETKVTVRFTGVKLKDAMKTLTDITGKSIVWDQSIEDIPIEGLYQEQQLCDVLENVSRRCKTTLSEVSGGYYLGEYRKGDMVSAVIRIPPVDRVELEKAIGSIANETDKAVLLGSFIWVTGSLDSVRKLVEVMDDIRDKSERSYLAEVYFIKVNENDFLRLTADLRINQVDIFASTFNVEQLFSMFVDADGQLGSTLVDTRPVLLLSEGRKAEFNVGNEIVRERKSVNENGVIETTGTEKFTDGIILSLLLTRVSNERYSVDMELEVSTFDKTDSVSYIPNKNRSMLKSPGMLIKDNGVVYAGSLNRKDVSKVFGLFSLNAMKESDLLTIWVRVREMKYE